MLSVQADVMHCLSSKAIAGHLPKHTVKVNTKHDKRLMVIICCVLDVTFSSLTDRKLFKRYLVRILVLSINTTKQESQENDLLDPLFSQE